MNKIFLIMACFSLWLNGHSQTCQQPASPADVKKMSALVGTWTGEFEQFGKKSSISITFYEENRVLKAHITNAAHISGYVADVSLCSTNKFHFFGSRVNGEYFTYNGWLKDESLTGNYKIGKSCTKENQGVFKMEKSKT